MLLRSRLSRFLVTRLARAYGFLDPFQLLGRLRGFAQRSEIGEPIELLRAGVLFHARGLVNTKAIQHNLDWVWPYWVQRQFNPEDPSFIPRAFSFSHINLTHRNWTAVGLPGVPYYPIVDPRGLVTPLFDGWSLDFWWVPSSGLPLLPSQLSHFEQTLRYDGNLRVRSVACGERIELESETTVRLHAGVPECCVRLRVRQSAGGAVAVVLRPYNPEGISFVERIKLLADGRGWSINRGHPVYFSRRPQRQLLSNYETGDVFLHLDAASTPGAIECSAGMATAAALFSDREIEADGLELRIPIHDELAPQRPPAFARVPGWPEALAPVARLELAEATVRSLYEQAACNLVLFAPAEVYPGPYTYKRFWFRDAVFILHALLALGDDARVARALAGFLPRQQRNGYFLSQAGEWDSNGEVLWFYHRFTRFTETEPTPDWRRAVHKGARWIRRKRLPQNLRRREAGLLPAGFSAEHLGPNDFYYWDDFWGVAGLRAAAELLRRDDPPFAAECAQEAGEFLAAIVASFPSGPQRRFPDAVPASPYRRMDSGAIGSLVADYPLQLFSPGDLRISKTVAYLRDHCFRNGAFFQDMVHSGLNIYLTLQIAQVCLRAGEVAMVWTLLERAAGLASPTGQWPEAIHPRTGGGCMGDGQHLWAAAEWAMLVRHLFVREESGQLILGAGLHPRWLAGGPAALGPVLTPHGRITVRFSAHRAGVQAKIEGAWRGLPPPREFRVPGCAPVLVPAGDPRDEFQLPLQP